MKAEIFEQTLQTEKKKRYSLISKGNRKKRSISMKLTFGLIVTIVAISSISVFLCTVVASRRARTEIEQKATEYIVTLAEVLENSI